MNNKQLGRKLSTENINAKAARHAISLAEGFSTNASDAEIIGLFEILLCNMEDEAVSELIENYEEALRVELSSMKKLEGCQSKNKFLIRVNNQIKIIVVTDYKILSEPFLIKMQKGLVELLGNDALCDIKFLKQRVSKLTRFEKDEWNNYGFSTEGGRGIIKGTTVQFMDI